MVKIKSAATDSAYKEKMAIKYQDRRDEIDKILAHLLFRLLSGEKLPPTEDILLQLPIKLNVKSKLVQEIVLGKEFDMPKVIVSTNGAMSINPNLDWKDLVNYPLSQDVCKSFLEM